MLEKTKHDPVFGVGVGVGFGKPTREGSSRNRAEDGLLWEAATSALLKLYQRVEADETAALT